MKIRIQDFGPIRDFEIDFSKDLHILYGGNNIGKSYAVILSYILLKHLKPTQGSIADWSFDLSRSSKASALISEYLKRNIESERSSIDFDDLIRTVALGILEAELAPKIQRSIESSFSGLNSLSNRLSHQQSRITINFGFGAITISLFEERVKFESMVVGRQIDLSYHLREEVDAKQVLERPALANDLWIEISKEKNETKEIIVARVLQLIRTYISLFIQDSYGWPAPFCKDVYFMPASRSGLYEAMSIFGSVFAKLAQLRFAVNEKIDIPALSEPVSDYFLELSAIKQAGKVNDKMLRIATQIEDEILQGRIAFNADSKRLEYHNEQTLLNLDMANSSSMVSELAPIVAYLKYVLIDGDSSEPQEETTGNTILFIEEPEAHLHPQVQVKLMQAFANLSKCGVKVILTTHSNYIFNKASNMILKGEVEPESVANYHMIMTPEGSIVNPEPSLHDWGMDDNNFAEVAEELLDERTEALLARNNAIGQ